MFRLQRYWPLLAIAIILCAIVPAPGAPRQAGTPAATSSQSRKPLAEVQALIDAGQTAQKAQPPRLDQAEKAFIDAAAEARRRGDTKGEAEALRCLGNLYSDRNEAVKALEFYQRSLAICRTSGDADGQGLALLDIGILFQAGLPDQSIARLQEALPLFRSAGDSARMADTSFLLGNAFAATGKYDQAQQAEEQALSLYQAIGREESQANTLFTLGNLHSYDRMKRGDAPPDFAGASTYFERAIVLYHNSGNVAQEARLYTQLGGLALSEGRLDEARTDDEKALGLFRQINDPALIAYGLNQLGSICSLQNRLIEALRYDQEALTMARKSGDVEAEAEQLVLIADIYTRFGQQKTALQTLQKAVPLFQQTKAVDPLVSTLHSIGVIYNILGDHRTAVATFNQVLPLLEKPGSEQIRRRNLILLAGVYRDTGNLQKAHELLEQQLAETTKSGESSSIANIDSLLGLVERELGRTDSALKRFWEELQQARAGGDRLEQANALGSIAEIEEENGHNADAERDYAESVGLLEQVRSRLGGLTEAKSTFLNAYLGTYQQYLSLLVHDRKPDAAFALAQKMKARALLDLLDDGKVQIASSLTASERKKETELREKSDALNYRLVKEGVQNEVGSRKRAELLKQQIAEAERDLQVFEDALLLRHPDVATKRAASTATVGDVAKILPADTALLEYVTLNTGKLDELLLIVVTQSAGRPSLWVQRIPIRQPDLTRRVDAMRRACSDPRKSYRSAAAAVFESLIAPAEARIAGKKRLLICPDGPLWDVPFAALPANRQEAASPTGRFLIDRFEIDYAYSATGAAAALTTRRRTAPSGALVFANPDFGDAQRFGDAPSLPGQRPLPAPSRPLGAPSRPLGAPSRKAGSASRPIDAPSRPIGAPSRPISAPSRLTGSADRPISAPSRPIGAPSRVFSSPDRPIGAPSRSVRDPSRLVGNPDRSLGVPSRAVSSPDRAIAAPSRDLFVPRGGSLASLPGTQREAEAIRADIPGAVLYTGARAQEAAAKREAGRYRYLHFATHGFFNDAAPLLSAIVLARPDPRIGEDGFLTAREVFDLNLHADLVVLSACNTARGEKRSGEGLIGLTWALFAAGAPAQVVSQWAVNDASTAALMQAFYANLTRRHMARGAALRQAALGLMRAGNTAGRRPGFHPAASRARRGRRGFHSATASIPRRRSGFDPAGASVPRPSLAPGGGRISTRAPERWAHPYYWAPFILMGDWR